MDFILPLNTLLNLAAVDALATINLLNGFLIRMLLAPCLCPPPPSPGGAKNGTPGNPGTFGDLDVDGDTDDVIDVIMEYPLRLGLDIDGLDIFDGLGDELGLDISLGDGDFILGLVILIFDILLGLDTDFIPEDILDGDNANDDDTALGLDGDETL